jgi:hypothetical protein
VSIDGFLDQEIVVKDVARAALSYVDLLVDEAIASGKEELIADFVRDQKASMHISGLSLAKLLYRWREAREMFGISNDDFEDRVFEQTGISPQTTRKYVLVWETVFVKASLPEAIENALLGKPMQGLLLLPAAVQEGQLDDEDWEEIASAPDPASIKEVVRAKRGKVTNSHTAVTIYLKRDGTLIAHQGEEQEAIGYLNLNTELACGAAAVSRILREARVVER